MQKNHSKISVAFLYDDTIDNSDGVAQYVKALGAWLGANGHKVTYLVGQSQTDQWAGGKVYSLSRNLKVIWNGNRLSISLLPKLRLMRQVLDREHFDVVHAMVPYSPFMAQPLIKRLSKQIALVGTVHIFPANFISAWGSKILRLIYGKSLRRFNAMLSVSSAAQAYALDSFKLQTQVLPNVVDLGRFKVELPKRPDAPTIVFLGRLVPRKGCLQLIKAFAELKKELPEAQLIIGGKGPQKNQLEAYVRQNQINDVSFVGFVAEEDKPAFLAQADVACFPSLYGESFGIVLIEAMAAGAQVVLGGNNPGYASVLAEQPNLLVDPKNTSQFVSRLKLLLTDRQKIAELHSWQAESVKQYDVAVVGKKLVEVYSAAIALQKQNEHN